MPPVEGFSNFLWVVVLAPFFKLGLFDPYILPKLLSAALIGATYYIIRRTIIVASDDPITSFFILLALSLNASFTIWSCSGLENALLVFLVALYLYAAVTWSTKTTGYFLFSIICGLLTAALGMVRPDGIVYAIVFPVLAVIVGVIARIGARRTFYWMLWFGATLAVSYGSFLIFRYLYFGDLYPNTYYVKGGPTFQMLKAVLSLQEPYLAKLQDLLASILGNYGTGPLALFLGIQATWAILRGGRSRYQLIPLTLLVTSLLAYLLLGTDWMLEYRFASPLFVMVYVCVFLFIFDLFGAAPGAKSWRRLAPLALGVLLLVVTWQVHTPRLTTFAKAPTVPFERVARLYGTTYDQLAAIVQVPGASVLLPDLGGPLYYSHIRVYDLAGLCDRTIARTRRKNPGAFYDYVFEDIRPTFIHTHGFFSAVSRFERDGRFRRDYVAIADSLAPYFGDSVLTGDYVRRDALAGKAELLADLRDALSL